MSMKWEAIGAVAGVLTLISYLYVEREKFSMPLRVIQLVARGAARKFVPEPPRPPRNASRRSPPPAQGRSRGALLEVVRSESWHDPVRIDSETIFGRKPDAGVFALGDRYMSGRHTRIRVSGGRVYVADLDSKNRTYVNDQPLDPHHEHEMRFGDTVRMGNTVLRLVEVRR